MNDQLSAMGEVDSSLDDVESIRHHDSMPYDQRSPQRLEASMVQWLADDPMA